MTQSIEQIKKKYGLITDREAEVALERSKGGGLSLADAAAQLRDERVAPYNNPAEYNVPPVEVDLEPEVDPGTDDPATEGGEALEEAIEEATAERVAESKRQARETREGNK